MINEEQFQEIRPYRNDEFAQAVKTLLEAPQINMALQTIFPETPVEAIKERIKSFTNIKEFQKHIIYDVLTRILKRTSTSFTFSGIENIKGGEPYLYISNHRDIVLDPSLISYALVENEMDIPEVAIGDNLIKEEWLRYVIRINRSFIVKRNLAPRQLVLSSRVLSNYIHHTITVNNDSVWIAQREGRAKDGNDVTQSGLLGMLSMAATEGVINHFLTLNPTPVSISYEYDPTDLEKVKRIYAERFLGGYKKESKEDEHSMRNGILGFKGGIHIHFGQPLKDKIGDLSHDLHKAEVENKIRTMLDQQIIAGYKLWPVNYIARDLYLGESQNEHAHYTSVQKDEFIKRVEERIGLLEGDKEELRRIFYEIYGRPAINKSKMSVSDEIFNS